MDEGLSHRAAAKLAGVSKTAIGKAIATKNLNALATGKVTAAALHAWMAGRCVCRLPRGCRAAAEFHRDSYVAQLRQIEYEREAGKVLEVEVEAKLLGDQLAYVRNRLLAIPAEQSPRLFRAGAPLAVAAVFVPRLKPLQNFR